MRTSTSKAPGPAGVIESCNFPLPIEHKSPMNQPLQQVGIRQITRSDPYLILPPQKKQQASLDFFPMELILPPYRGIMQESLRCELGTCYGVKKSGGKHSGTTAALCGGKRGADFDFLGGYVPVNVSGSYGDRSGVNFGGEKNDGSSTCALKIQVIDDTALVDVSKIVGIEDDDGRKKEIGRRSGKRVKHGKGNGNLRNLVNVGGRKKGFLKIGYTREEMEALRFVNVRGQRKVWHEVYNGLASNVRNEYDGLGSFRNQKQHGILGFDPCQAVGRRNNFQGILGVAAARGRGTYLNTFVY